MRETIEEGEEGVDATEVATIVAVVILETM
jgi:hypothetical protein